MIDWVHEACKDWGDYMRKNPKSWPEKSTSWRMWMEQGISSDSFGPSNPDWNMPKMAIAVHSVYRNMPEMMRAVMIACYVWRGEPKKKADRLEISRSKMYEIRTNAHHFIAGQLIAKDSGI